ncbi:hypothetical protein PSCLAVI8L_50143 [Pseudoclavibacter sp. 8L]|nr:hypothetical protein PSCLAVI8L_50143 [Pseudoclavibacter sp. 8L]
MPSPTALERASDRRSWDAYASTTPVKRVPMPYENSRVVPAAGSGNSSRSWLSHDTYVNSGHHFLGRTFSTVPHTSHVSVAHTGRLPVRFARDCASHAGGFASSSANASSAMYGGRPFRFAISRGMSRRIAASCRLSFIPPA